MVRSGTRWSVVSVVTLSAALSIPAASASAACASTPWSSPTVVCVEVEGDPDPQVDTSPTVDAPVFCGFAGLCVAVGWDGVSVEDVTVTASVSAGLIHHSFEHTVPGQETGPVCVFTGGLDCPEQ